jgi:hypothetical protein
MLATLNSRQIVDEIVKDTVTNNDPHDAVQISPDIVLASRPLSAAPALAPEITTRPEVKIDPAFILKSRMDPEPKFSPVREPQAAAVMMIPIPRRGHLRRVDGEALARAVPFVEDVRITAKQDQLLEPLPEAGSYLGFIFARAADPALATQAVRDAHARLSFLVDAEIGVRRV